MVWSYHPFRCSLVRWRPRVGECRPPAVACTQRIRRKLVQSMSEHFTARNTLRAMILQKASSSCECKIFPSCSSAVHELLFSCVCPALFAGWTVEKKDCDPSVKRSNRLLSQLASQRHNLLEVWFAQSNSESNPNFVKNVACIQN